MFSWIWFRVCYFFFSFLEIELYQRWPVHSRMIVKQTKTEKNNYSIDRRIYPNLFKSIQSAAELKIWSLWEHCSVRCLCKGEHRNHIAFRTNGCFFLLFEFSVDEREALYTWCFIEFEYMSTFLGGTESGWVRTSRTFFFWRAINHVHVVYGYYWLWLGFVDPLWNCCSAFSSRSEKFAGKQYKRHLLFVCVCVAQCFRHCREAFSMTC